MWWKSCDSATFTYIYPQKKSTIHVGVNIYTIPVQPYMDPSWDFMIISTQIFHPWNPSAAPGIWPFLPQGMPSSTHTPWANGVPMLWSNERIQLFDNWFLWGRYKSLRIQVCPKKGINPTILLWGWDWDHQTYSREGYGSLGNVLV